MQLSKVRFCWKQNSLFRYLEIELERKDGLLYCIHLQIIYRGEIIYFIIQILGVIASLLFSNMYPKGCKMMNWFSIETLFSVVFRDTNQPRKTVKLKKYLKAEPLFIIANRKCGTKLQNRTSKLDQKQWNNMITVIEHWCLRVHNFLDDPFLLAPCLCKSPSSVLTFGFSLLQC